jgi:hypothetical protein
LDRAEQYGEQNRTPACPAIRSRKLDPARCHAVAMLACGRSTRELLELIERIGKAGRHSGALAIRCGTRRRHKAACSRRIAKSYGVHPAMISRL